MVIDLRLSDGDRINLLFSFFFFCLIIVVFPFSTNIYIYIHFFIINMFTMILMGLIIGIDS